MRYEARKYRDPIMDDNNLSKMKPKALKTFLESLETIDFRNMNLEGESFNNLDLTKANFEGAMLGGTTIESAKLMGVNLERVDFTYGSLSDSDLTGARISEADFVGTDLRNAVLVGIESVNVFFDHADLRNAKLMGSKFTVNTSFYKAKLKDADFTGAELQHAEFAGAKLNNTIFTDAKLQHASFEGLDLRNVVLTGADLTEALLLDATLEGMNLQTIVSMQGADLRDANLRGAQLQGVQLQGASLRGADLRGAQLQGVQLQGAALYRADLTGADLTGANLTGANLSSATLTGVIGANFEGAIIVQETVQQPVVQIPQGQAFEIHNYFHDLDFEKFLEIIRGEIIRPENAGNELLEPLIDYTTSFSVEKAEELDGINDTIKSYESRDIQAIQDTITFVLSQPEDFKKTYINNLSQDCLFAYEFDSTRPDANRKSCVKGQYERVFMTLEGVLEAHCKDNPDETICPPLYKELLLCFKPNYNGLFSEWFDTQDPETDGYSGKNLEEKGQYINTKKAELREFIVERLGGERNSINEYLNKVVNGKNQFEAVYETYAGGKRRINKSKKVVVKIIKTRAKPKAKPGKKSRGKKDKRKKSQKK